MRCLSDHREMCRPSEGHAGVWMLVTVPGSNRVHVDERLTVCETLPTSTGGVPAGRCLPEPHMQRQLGYETETNAPVSALSMYWPNLL
jgi:hypothetical protein